MKTYEIHFYHSGGAVLDSKLKHFCVESWHENGKSGWVYQGTLDNFAEQFDGMFMVTKNKTIYVTQHNSWGAR